jgi:hypothetical protein
MFQPHRLRTRNPPPQRTTARRPSHFGSKAYPYWSGSRPERASIGCGRADTPGTYFAARADDERVRQLRRNRLIGRALAHIRALA